MAFKDRDRLDASIVVVLCWVSPLTITRVDRPAVSTTLQQRGAALGRLTLLTTPTQTRRTARHAHHAG